MNPLILSLKHPKQYKKWIHLFPLKHHFASLIGRILKYIVGWGMAREPLTVLFFRKKKI